MSLAELFAKSDMVNNVIKAAKLKPRAAIVVNAEAIPEHIAIQISRFEAGAPQMVTRASNGLYIAHSAFKGGK